MPFSTTVLYGMLGLLAGAALLVGCRWAGRADEEQGTPTRNLSSSEARPVMQRSDAASPPISWSWSEPAPLPLGALQLSKAAHHAEACNLIVHQGTLHVTFQARGEEQPADDVFVMQKQGGAWTEPINVSQRGQTMPYRPNLTRDAENDILHAVWAERARFVPRDSSRGFLMPTDLFYATNEGGEWSAPQNLFQTKIIDYNHGDKKKPRRDPASRLRLSKNIIADHKGRLHLAFSGQDSTTEGASVLYMQRSSGTWSKTQIVARGLYPDLAQRGTHELFLGHTMAAKDYARRTNRRDINSVFLTTSTDGGATWGKPVLVHRSWIKVSHAPSVVVDAKGRVHMLWLKSMVDGQKYPPDAIWHSFSEDDKTWSEAAPIADALPGHPFSLEVAADSAGGLHAAFKLGAGLGRRPYEPYYAYWNGAAWSAPEHLFGFVDAGSAMSLAVDDARQRLHLVLSAKDGSEGDRHQFYHAWRALDAEE